MAAGHGNDGIKKEKWHLEIPEGLIKDPIVYEIGHKFSLITNIEKANIENGGLGIIMLEISGDRNNLDKAEYFLIGKGIKIVKVL